jgi:serine/threonine protein kinase/ankyrin repeat protein
MPERWQQIEEIFHDVLERKPEQRGEYLDQICGGDPSLRRQIEGLIASDEKAAKESFLGSPISAAYEDSSLKIAHLTGRILDGKYSIEKQLGQGGMGAVFLATHLGTKRQVAIKVIMPQYMANNEFVERFKREAEAAGRLRHPNVVNVTDFGFAQVGAGQVAYLVMEYLDGRTLADLLEEKQRLPLRLVIDITEQVCLAIDEAHRHGIIHRDLKPENIWLEPNRRGGYNVKVLDLGLAKLHGVQQSNLQAETGIDALPPLPVIEPTEPSTANGNAPRRTIPALDAGEKDTLPLDQRNTGGAREADTDGSGLTRIGAVIGTPLYMSPEQCRGEALDARSDIYSLGVIVYRMLAGVTPFVGNMYTLIAQHKEAEPPELKEKRRDIPKPVTKVVMSALSKQPADRPAGAEAFAIALRANSEGEVPILRQAFDLYRRRFFTFLSVSAAVFTPFILINFLLLFTIALLPMQGRPALLIHIIQKGYLLFSLLVALLANSVNTAACSLVVDQLREDPLKPLKTGRLISDLRLRFGGLVYTVVRGYISALLRIPLILPGAKKYIDNSLSAPVVIIEGLKGNEALERSGTLVGRLRSISVSIQIRDLLIASLSLFALLVSSVMLRMIFDLKLEENMFARIDNLGTIFFLSPFAIVFLKLAFIPILIHPLIAVATALLYYKTRRLNGEVIDEADYFEYMPADIPERSKLSRKRTAGLAFVLLVLFAIWAGGKDRLLLLVSDSSDFSYTLRLLVAAGADVNARDEYGATALILSAHNPKAVRELIVAGADVSAMANNGDSALVRAIEGDKLESVELLLEAGADVNASGADGKTALIKAAERGLTPIVKRLIAARANIDGKGNFKNVHFDSGYSDYNIMTKILSDTGMFSSSHNVGETALMMAAGKDHYETVKVLIDAGADVNARGYRGWTPLMIAACRGHSGIVTLLLASGADLNAKDEMGKTALILATEGSMIVREGSHTGPTSGIGERMEDLSRYSLVIEKLRFAEITGIK